MSETTKNLKSEWWEDETFEGACDQCASPYHTTDFCPFGEMVEGMDVEAVIRAGAAAAEAEHFAAFERLGERMSYTGEEPAPRCSCYRGGAEGHMNGCPIGGAVPKAARSYRATDGERIAWERAETDSCERGTPGCCIAHTGDTPCDTW